MHISQLDHLRSNSCIRFKQETVHGKDLEIVSYMIGDKELWNDPAALETRGNTYDVQTGECVCACFPKFFNVNEREDTQQDLIKDQVFEVYEKRDGSMVTPVLIDGEIIFKTKKSFYSDVANLANQVATEKVIQISQTFLKNQFTPIWEFTHPDCKIVIDYDPKDHFTLLAIRSQVTGEFLSYNFIQGLFKQFLIPRLQMTWDELMYSVEHDKGIEGYVLLLKDGRRVKLKCSWYLSLHHTMTELRERDVVEAVLNETIDDIKSLLVSQGKDLSPIERIEHQVTYELIELGDQVRDIVWRHLDWSIKDVALKFKDHPLFSLIMTQIRGKEPNYSDYWKRHHFQEYSLRCVYNQNF